MMQVQLEQDLSKELELYEVGAKKGSLLAHRNLADFHAMKRNIDESVNHCKVAASAGDQDSMDKLMIAYKDKLLPKDDLTQVLRAFQTAKNAMTSKDRDLARSIFGRYKPRQVKHIRDTQI